MGAPGHVGAGLGQLRPLWDPHGPRWPAAWTQFPGDSEGHLQALQQSGAPQDTHSCVGDTQRDTILALLQQPVPSDTFQGWLCPPNLTTHQ